MLTKVKRVRRQKFAVGDEARKFTNIPTASQPQQQQIGTRQEFADKYVTSQVATPEIAAAAKQQYTQQAVQPTELLTGTTMAAPTDVGTTTITGQQITAPTAGVSVTAPQPTALTAAQMTAATGTAQQAQAQAGALSQAAQVGTVTGTLTGTATGATAGPTSSAIAQAQQGQLSSGALAQVIQGTSATVNAQTATLPPNIQAAVATNPAQVAATIMQQPPAVQAQVASLPTDALVSSQMTTLLDGIDTGQIPTWARGAVENVEKNLAARGLSKSTIAREALVNAIIQSTLPIAQSNATALQQRASQNLSNEQQAAVLTAQQNFQTQLVNAENDMKARMMTGQFAQEITKLNAMNEQQAILAGANQQQQVRLANLANLQQAGLTNAQLQQQMSLANLNVNQQASLANAQTIAGMDVLNLNNQQQTAISNSNLFRTFELQNLNNTQQATMQNAVQLATMDMANLSNAQQKAVLNAQAFLKMDMANLTNAQQTEVLNTQNRQQAMLSDQAANNAARQFNATSDNQTQQFVESLSATINTQNAARNDAMTQYNISEANRVAALNQGNNLEAQRLQETLNSQINQFNEQLDYNRNQFNTQNSLAIEQSNVAWRRQLNTANTAGVNAVNQANAMNAFNLSNQALSFIWQEMRDAAKWEYESAQNSEERQTNLAIAALGNEAAADQGRANTLKTLGGFALDIWKRID